MVSTLTGKLLSVSSESFNSSDPDNPTGAEVLLAAPASSITDVAAHPLRPELLLLDADSGQLLRWDMASRQCVAQRQLGQDVKAARLAVARDGEFVVVGCAGGQLLVLKGDTLEQVVALKNTRQPIARVSVSSSGRHIAAADGAGQVLLYGFLPYKGTFLKWDLVGKFRAHQKEVIGLHFGEAPSGQTRLFSLGADRRLLEYNLAAADAANAGLRALAVLDVVAPGGAGTPCSMCFAPPMPYYSHASMDTLLLVADDAFKVKAYNPDAKAASATHLGPTFGGPISKLLPFRSVTDGGAWLAYSTAEQLVGLIAWPLDGDPQHSMGVIAHPGDVRGLALSFDGRKLLTLGEHGIINVWDVNTAALGPQPSRQASFGSSSAAAAQSRWSHLLGDPALLEELRDCFCYAQLLAQPQDTAGAYDITGRVPISLLPDLMRAAGYYPSNADIDRLMAHVAFLAAMVPDDEAAISSSGGTNSSRPGAASDEVAVAAAAGPDGAGSRTGSAGSSRLKQADVAATAGQVQQQQQQEQKGWQIAMPAAIDFDTFLCLFVNHRPVTEVSLQQIEQAFSTLGAGTAAGVMSSQRLLELLQQGGEAMSQEELLQVLQALTGAAQPEDAIPEYVDARTFTAEVLGFAG
ncbi:quinon protein alcohol dehydrogenase-like superfamily [Scenedesmus sp. NREL 46B-D3]|nr:quinon protein alcohol dehydrogenase-like superfamily [Scenedesmus sp. NREL 46B-D3]